MEVKDAIEFNLEVKPFSELMEENETSREHFRLWVKKMIKEESSFYRPSYPSNEIYIIIVWRINEKVSHKENIFKAFFHLEDKGIAQTDWIDTDFPSSEIWSWTDLNPDFSVIEGNEIIMIARAWRSYPAKGGIKGHELKEFQKKYCFKLKV